LKPDSFKVCFQLFELIRLSRNGQDLIHELIELQINNGLQQLGFIALHLGLCELLKLLPMVRTNAFVSHHLYKRDVELLEFGDFGLQIDQDFILREHFLAIKDDL